MFADTVATPIIRRNLAKLLDMCEGHGIDRQYAGFEMLVAGFAAITGCGFDDARTSLVDMLDKNLAALRTSIQAAVQAQEGKPAN